MLVAHAPPDCICVEGGDACYPCVFFPLTQKGGDALMKLHRLANLEKQKNPSYRFPGKRHPKITIYKR
eukprot:3194472-Amphidinium_carterae.1